MDELVVSFSQLDSGEPSVTGRFASRPLTPDEADAHQHEAFVGEVARWLAWFDTRQSNHPWATNIRRALEELACSDIHRAQSMLRLAQGFVEQVLPPMLPAPEHIEQGLRELHGWFFQALRLDAPRFELFEALAPSAHAGGHFYGFVTRHGVVIDQEAGAEALWHRLLHSTSTLSDEAIAQGHLLWAAALERPDLQHQTVIGDQQFNNFWQLSMVLSMASDIVRPRQAEFLARLCHQVVRDELQPFRATQLLTMANQQLRAEYLPS